MHLYIEQNLNTFKDFQREQFTQLIALGDTGSGKSTMLDSLIQGSDTFENKLITVTLYNGRKKKEK